MYLKVKWIIL